MQKLSNKTITFLSLILSAVLFAGCSGYNDTELTSDGCQTITDERIIGELSDFKFEYAFDVPGAEYPYRYLIDGNVQSEEKNEQRTLFTYLTEHGDDDGYYYLAYMKTDDIKKYSDELTSYEKQNEENHEYHFTKHDEVNVIDGKYLFAYERLKLPDVTLKYLKTDDIKNVKYKISDYTLVFCAQRKTITVKQNVTTGNNVNNTITLYKRTELVFEDENASPLPYVFDTNEKTNQARINELFSYRGEMLEAYYKTCETVETEYYPIFRIRTVRAKITVKDGVKYVSLPRYKSNGDEKTDLLTGDESQDPYENVYGAHKNQFLDAVIEVSDTEESSYTFGKYYFALYDYDNVTSILKTE